MSDDPLPPGTFDAALADFAAVQERRVRAMFVRNRAVFAEFVVASLLPGAAVVEDPGCAWDITWMPPSSDVVVRIQVKCSGKFVPRRPKQPSAARWDLKTPKWGYDPEKHERLGPGHHCDVFVLARHEGEQIETGWSFAVARHTQLAEYRDVTLPRLRELGIDLVWARGSATRSRWRSLRGDTTRRPPAQAQALT